jgi:hypothetical protein
MAAFSGRAELHARTVAPTVDVCFARGLAHGSWSVPCAFAIPSGNRSME